MKTMQSASVFRQKRCHITDILLGFSSVLPYIMMAACLIILSTPANAANQGNKPTIAVLTLDVQEGVTKPEAQILADRLAIELDRTGRFILINRQRMAEQLELQKFSRLDNCSASECAVEAGQILEASHIAYGSIGKVGRTLSLNTYLIEVESGATLRSISTDISGGIEEMLTQGMAANATRLATPVAIEKGDNASNKPTCAILTFDSRGGVSRDEVLLFSDRFAIEIDSLAKYTLVPRTKMEEILDEQQFAQSGSCSATECAIEAGKLLGVRYMAYGSIGKIGSIYTINSYLVDVESGVAVKTATTDHRGDKESVLVQGMRKNAKSLLGIQRQQGYLNIDIWPVHADLTVNGENIQPGLVPVPADKPVTVSANANGFSSYSQMHKVQSGETTKIDIRLQANHPLEPHNEKPHSQPLPNQPQQRPRVH